MKLKINNTSLLIVILLIGAFLRFYHLDFQSLWLDEIHTLNEANPEYTWTEFHELLMLADPHPPMYFAILKVLFGLFGYKIAILRVFSAILGVVGIYGIYLLGKEIKDKKLGLISAALLAVNYYHIYYSQEARMYVMLFLFTVLSFYRLIVLVKKPTLKNAIWYGILTGLLMQSHFFAFFVLASQFFILLFFLYKTEKTGRIAFFYKLIISSGIIVAMFLPALKIFIKTTEIKSFWIQPTTFETIKQIFKDFFFDYDPLLIITGITTALCLFFIFKDKNENEEKKWILGIIIPWLILVLLIPIIRSYLSVPMIISRYFITILPPVILLSSVGIYKLKKEWLQIIIVASIMVISVHMLFFKRNYYEEIAKTQFREITNHIKELNNSNDDVVSLRGWYLSYFLKEKNTPIISKDFQTYMNEISTDSTSIRSFWYLGAFGDPYSIDAKSEEFLNKNYNVADEKHLFDCWAKHYILKNSNLNKQEIPSNATIQLSNVSDQNWSGGVGKQSNMLLLEYTEQNEKLVKNTRRIEFSDKSTVNVVGYEKVGNYIHLFLDKEAKEFTKKASYPSKMELLK